MRSAGWNDWQTPVRSGRLAARNAVPELNGPGLTARYYQGSKLVLETVEPPIYFEPFGSERHADNVSPHYKAVWTGQVVPPVSDRFQFRSLLGKAEQVAVWIDGRIIHANGFERRMLTTQWN